jgi:hypothetical protein
MNNLHINNSNLCHPWHHEDSVASDEQNIWEASDEQSRRRMLQDDPQFQHTYHKTVAFNLETNLKSYNIIIPMFV